MPTLTQKRRRLKFWIWAATLAVILFVIGSAVGGSLSPPGSMERWLLPTASVCIAFVMIPYLLKTHLQLREVQRTGDAEALDDAYREHVVDKGGYIHKRQVKTWMWVVPVSLILLIALGIALYLIYDLHVRLEMKGVD